jgi:hypothetical protein
LIERPGTRRGRCRQQTGGKRAHTGEALLLHMQIIRPLVTRIVILEQAISCDMKIIDIKRLL